MPAEQPYGEARSALANQRIADCLTSQLDLFSFVTKFYFVGSPGVGAGSHPLAII
jgi:hypothetical protein